MRKDMYLQIEKYMLTLMNDSAHDSQHIYRVLYYALDIANEINVDKDVLIAASLLHDIGREAQNNNPECDHAIVGADMAYDFLRGIGWSDCEAAHVKACISTHRYRNNNSPKSIEAKVLYDADKLDSTGTMGIARTLIYNGIISQPLYYVDEFGKVLDGRDDNIPSFFREYNWKLKNIYDKFYTNSARLIAEERRKSSIEFYENIYNEVCLTHQKGLCLLKDELGY
jgi:uncharacterized protein